MDEAREADKLAVAAIQSARNDVADYERTAAVPERSDEPAYQEAESAGLGGILNDLFFGGGSGGVRRVGRLVVGRLLRLRRLVELETQRIRRSGAQRLLPAQQRRLVEIERAPRRQRTLLIPLPKPHLYRYREPTTKKGTPWQSSPSSGASRSSCARTSTPCSTRPKTRR